MTGDVFAALGDPTRRWIVERLSDEGPQTATQLAADLPISRQAVAKHELRIYYQPQFDVSTMRVSGMEALLRWEHPDLGLLQPASFISLTSRPIGR